MGGDNDDDDEEDDQIFMSNVLKKDRFALPFTFLPVLSPPPPPSRKKWWHNYHCGKEGKKLWHNHCGGEGKRDRKEGGGEGRRRGEGPLIMMITLPYLFLPPSTDSGLVDESRSSRRVSFGSSGAFPSTILSFLLSFL
jgi:hypothetical protein